MKIIDNIFQKFKLHENYINKVREEREKIKGWTDKQLEGYIESYFNYGLSGLRNFFGETFLGEPARIEACIEVYGQRVGNNLYPPHN